MKLTTLCYPIVDGRVLLAMKKRDFGIGKWNAPGGKLKPDETIEAALRREVMEEVGITPGPLEHRGIIEFVFEGKPDWDNTCHVFVTSSIVGVPRESDEMIPEWFTFEDVPYGDMWEDDIIWLPSVLKGGSVSLRFFFDADGKMLRHETLPEAA